MISSSNSPQGMSVRDGLDRETAETLKWFARLLGGDKRIIRKTELISLIAGHLKGDHLRELWRGLDHNQQAAIAETIHSQSLRFDEARFRAKYDQVPDFGSEHYYYYAHSKRGPTLARLLLIVVVLAAEVGDLIVLRPKASFVKPEALGMDCFRYRSLLIMIEPTPQLAQMIAFQMSRDEADEFSFADDSLVSTEKPGEPFQSLRRFSIKPIPNRHPLRRIRR